MNHTPAPTLVYAHRGASAELPENTLEAFELALALGVDALETDTRLTRDGVPVLSHDPDARRHTDDTTLVRSQTRAEIGAWDLGRRWRASAPDRTGVFRLPTLEEALVAFPQARFNVDLKEPDPALALAVLAVLEKLDAFDRVCLASFHQAPLSLVRQRAPHATTSLCAAEARWLALAPKALFRLWRPTAQRAQLPVRAGPLRLDSPGFLAKARSQGLAVDYWVINDPAEAARLTRLGADGVMTDDPRRVVPAVRTAASAL